MYFFLFWYIVPIPITIVLTVLYFSTKGFKSLSTVGLFILTVILTFVPMLNIVVCFICLMPTCIFDDVISYRVRRYIKCKSSAHSGVLSYMNKLFHYDGSIESDYNDSRRKRYSNY